SPGGRRTRPGKPAPVSGTLSYIRRSNRTNQSERSELKSRGHRKINKGERVMLKVHTRKLGNVAVVSVQGRIVNGETASLRQEVDAQSRVNTLLLDLGRVSTIDASGLGLMLEMREQAQSKGMRFKLMNVTRLVSRVLEVTKLDSVFE